MFNIMYSRNILTIAGFVVVVMMNLIYFAKARKKNTLKHKLYSYFISINAVMLAVELIIMLMFSLDMPFDKCVIAFKIRDILLITYFTIVLFYYYVFINKIQYDKFITFLRSEKMLRPHYIFTIIVIILDIVLPYNEMTSETFNYALGGLAYYVTIGYCVLTTLETIYICVFKSKKEIDYSERLSLIWIFSLMIVILVFQVLFDEVAIMGIVSAVYILVLYFLFENPDLELVEEIDSFTKDIERANNTKIDLLSNISKEMISPMNSIVILSESIISDDNFDEIKVHEDIKQIELASKNFLEIINNTLDISNIESEKDTLYEKEYSLETLLTSLINIIQEKIVSKNIKLILNIDKTIPRNLIGDYNKVYQILLNIVTNSIKYTEVGRINITLNKEIQNSKIILKFIISDTGFGIKKEDYDKVFQKHTRLDDVVSRGIEGTGLGLSLTKKYVELLGGKIWFESVYAAGTDFYIDIPQQIANMDYTIGELKAPKENNLKQENLIDCSQYRILLVEDDKLNLEVTKRLFERYNFVIDTCTNGKDCIFKYKEGEQYNMILIDHKMPEMSGIEVMQVIRQLKDYKTPILVALTANAFSDSREMYIKDGFDDYLAKPVDINELDVLVNKYFNK